MAQVSVSKLSASTQRSHEARGAGPPGGARPQARYECTYKMGPDRKFLAHRAGAVLETVLSRELAGASYEPERGPALCRRLADDVRNGVKELGYGRYKIVAFVTLGSAGRAAASCSSQCVWNEKFDTYSEFTFKNGSLYALGIVYGMYQE